MRVGGRDWLYAIGDVNGRSLLTHMGKYQARVAAENILGRDRVACARRRALTARRSSPIRRSRRSATRSTGPRRPGST